MPGLSREACAQVTTLRLPSAPRPSPGNPWADDLTAAVLGHYLFFDARLSADQSVRCATCHLPERLFTDGLAVSKGLAPTTRNSPSVLVTPYLEWFMWDGKADSLWSQPLMAFENEREMNFSRLELAHAIEAFHRERYEAVFGPMPDLSDPVRFPARGKPGDSAWEAMQPADRLTIDRVVSNAGKGLEAYQRQLAIQPGRFDDFLDGDREALSADERDGLRVFFTAGCIDCHRGPLFTDEQFHALQVPAPEGGIAERGRAAALEQLAASEFNRSGPFYEASPVPVPVPTAADEGAWRTPSLRNVARTRPYGHNGVFATLEAVVDFHLPATVTAREREQLLAFLRALDAGDAKQPWNGWPGR